MEGLESEQTRGWAGGGHGSFPLPPDCGDVVRRVVHSLLPNVEVLGQHIQLCHAAREFQLAVGDGAGGVI
jgi:hypothetical protein